eukprot:6181419-Heterocapsa_arctica.AAC.1
MPGEGDGDDVDFDGRGAECLLQLLGGRAACAATQNARDDCAWIETLCGVRKRAVRGVQFRCRECAAGTPCVFHFSLC